MSRPAGHGCHHSPAVVSVVGDVGLVPTSGPLTGLEMAAPRVVVVAAQPRPRCSSAPLYWIKWVTGCQAGTDGGEEWSKMNHGRIMIGMYLLLCVSYNTGEYVLLQRTIC